METRDPHEGLKPAWFLLPFATPLLAYLMFAPAALGFLAWIAFAPAFLYLLKDRSLRRVTAISFAVYFLVCTSISSVVFIISVLPVLFFGVVYGITGALMSALLHQGVHRFRLSPAFIAPPLWVLHEWCWINFWSMGFSQHEYLPLIQIADLGGVMGITALLIFSNITLAMAVHDRKRSLLPAAVLGGLFVLTLVYGMIRMNMNLKPGPKTLIVQPNYPVGTEMKPDEMISKLISMSRGEVDLIVWPETILPWRLSYTREDDAPVKNAFYERTQRVADELKADFVFGGISMSLPKAAFEGATIKPGDQLLANSAFVVRNGSFDRYDKVNLIAFGEYVPLGLKSLFNNMSVMQLTRELEPGTKPGVFGDFGTVICNEILRPGHCRETAKNVRFLVCLSNERWLGTTNALEHTFMAVPIRAVESRVGIVRSTNTGLSAFVSPTGEVEQILGKDVEGVLVQKVSVAEGSSLYRALGDWIVWLSLLTLGGAGWRARRGPAPSSPA